MNKLLKLILAPITKYNEALERAQPKLGDNDGLPTKEDFKDQIKRGFEHYF